jgi:Tfp pilus assembly protein PilX
MSHFSSRKIGNPRVTKQRGVVLFFALVALVAMSLAAVALIRSVDTSTIIAGNLAFKQSATSAGDGGIDAAMAWLANTEANNVGINVLNDASHHFNITNLATRPGYHSNAGTLDLFDNTTWDDDDNNNALVGTDAAGNTIRYVIERMCRNANQTIQNAECLFSSAIQDNNGQNIPLPQEVCSGAGCPVAGQTPQIRITARAQGPRGAVSYVQAFVY